MSCESFEGDSGHLVQNVKSLFLDKFDPVSYGPSCMFVAHLFDHILPYIKPIPVIIATVKGL